VKLGWTGLVPASCKGKTILVPLDQKWKVWGWPKRFTARMDGARVHVILTGPSGANKALTGIATPEQIPEIPREFKGYLWVEDIGVIGPGLRS
jgi:glycerophosphoryl diester phosphodiesterase